MDARHFFKQSITTKLSFFSYKVIRNIASVYWICNRLASPLQTPNIYPYFYNRDFHESFNIKFSMQPNDILADSMLVLCDRKWIDLKVSHLEFRPSLTFSMGQCFNWHRLNNDGSCWVGIIGRYPVAILEKETTSYFCRLDDFSIYEDDKMSLALVREYLQLDTKMQDLARSWIEQCVRMKVVYEVLGGIRILRQDPWECLISFICSSNNNIKRITLMLSRIRTKYGRPICALEYETDEEGGTGSWRVVSTIEQAKQTHSDILRTPQRELQSLDSDTLLLESPYSALLESPRSGYSPLKLLKNGSVLQLYGHSLFSLLFFIAS